MMRPNIAEGSSQQKKIKKLLKMKVKETIFKLGL